MYKERLTNGCKCQDVRALSTLSLQQNVLATLWAVRPRNQQHPTKDAVRGGFAGVVFALSHNANLAPSSSKSSILWPPFSGWVGGQD